MRITIDYNNTKWRLEQFSSWNLSILQCLKVQKLRKTMEEVQNVMAVHVIRHYQNP